MSKTSLNSGLWTNEDVPAGKVGQKKGVVRSIKQCQPVNEEDNDSVESAF